MERVIEKTIASGYNMCSYIEEGQMSRDFKKEFPDWVLTKEEDITQYLINKRYWQRSGMVFLLRFGIYEANITDGFNRKIEDKYYFFGICYKRIKYTYLDLNEIE